MRTSTPAVSEATSSPGLRPEVIQFAVVPVVKYLWPDSEALNAKLREVILARMTSSPGIVDTNVGGWHSERDLATWDDPAIEALRERIRAMARELVAITVANPTTPHFENWRIEGWANVNTRGATNKSHHHAGGGSRNLWSGIYYVSHGDAPVDVPLKTGLTKFEDRSGVPKEIITCHDPFERELTVVPKPGLMVFFPATLRHYVTPHAGDGERITIAINLKHDGFVIPRYPEAEPPSFLWRNLRGPMLVASKGRRALAAIWGGRGARGPRPGDY